MFISGLPYTTTEDELTTFLASDAVVEVKLPKFQDTGRCLGYAHVVFNDEEEYKKVMARSGESMGSRYLEMRPAKGKSQEVVNKKVNIPVGCKRLFVKGLPYEIEEEEIREEFSSCGIVTDLRMVRNWANKNFKGFAYIDYRDLGSVKKAIDKYHGKPFRGRNLILDAVTSGQKKGFHRHDPNYNPEGQES